MCGAEQKMGKIFWGEKMKKKNKTEKWKYWLIEDGSVNVDELQQFIDENNLKIKIIIYRQGSIKPELKSF